MGTQVAKRASGLSLAAPRYPGQTREAPDLPSQVPSGPQHVQAREPWRYARFVQMKMEGGLCCCGRGVSVVIDYGHLGDS